MRQTATSSSARWEGAPGAYETVGIESPGLTSAPAIAEMLVEQIARENNLSEKAEWKPTPKREEALLCHDAGGARGPIVQKDPSYGTLVCRCEEVTEAEIRAAIRRPVGARTIDAVQAPHPCGHGPLSGWFLQPARSGDSLRGTGHRPDRWSPSAAAKAVCWWAPSPKRHERRTPDMLSQELRSQVQYVDVLVIGAGPAGHGGQPSPRGKRAWKTCWFWNVKTIWAAFCASASITALACTASRKS